MKKYSLWLLFGSLLFIGSSLLVFGIHLIGYRLWMEGSISQLGYWLFAIGGLLGFVFVMIEGNILFRIAGIVLAAVVLYILFIISIFNATTVDVINSDLYVEKDGFLFASTLHFYERSGLIFAREIAVCDDGEDGSCTYEVEADKLIITECSYHTDYCDEIRISLE